jgi:hypothetical protein
MLSIKRMKVGMHICGMEEALLLTYHLSLQVLLILQLQELLFLHHTAVMAAAELAAAELAAVAAVALGSSSFNLQLIIPIVFPYIFETQ